MNGRELKKPLPPFDLCRIKTGALPGLLPSVISSRMPLGPTLSTERLLVRQFLPTGARPAIGTHPGHEPSCPASVKATGLQSPSYHYACPTLLLRAQFDTLDPIRHPSHTRVDVHPDGSHANHNANLLCPTS